MTTGYQFTHYTHVNKNQQLRLILAAAPRVETDRTFVAPDDGVVGRLWREEGPREWTPRRADGFFAILPVIAGSPFQIWANNKLVLSTTVWGSGMIGFLSDLCPFRKELTRQWFEQRSAK